MTGDIERDILRRTLGLDMGAEPCRNFLIAGLGCDVLPVIERMVDLGMLRQSAPDRWHATGAGARHVGCQLPAEPGF